MKKLLFVITACLIFCVLASCGLPAIITAAVEPEDVWVEVQCEIPSGFDANVGIILSNNETEEEYMITCRKINDYIGRAQLPAGAYTVLQTYTTYPDDFAFDAYTDLEAFELKADAEAAQLIVITVEASADVEQSPTRPIPSPSEGSIPETTPSTAPAVTEPTSKPTEGSAPETQPDKVPDHSEEDSSVSLEEADSMSFGIRILLSLIGIVVFVGAVFLIAYLYRRYSDRY